MAGKKRFFGGLQSKLLTYFLTLSIMSVLVIGIASYINSGKALKKQTFNQLLAVAEIKKNQIHAYFLERFSDLDVLSKSPSVISALEELKEAFEASEKDLAVFVSSTEYEAVNKKIDPWFRKYKESYSYYDFFLVDDNGNILYTVAHELDFGTNINTGRYSGSNLARLLKEVIRGEKADIVDFEAYAPSGDVIAAFISQVVYDNEGKKLGGVAVQISIDEMDSILTERTGMGDTGETYLVGNDYLMRSDSRFEQNTLMKRKVETEASKEALAGRSGQKIIKDYRGTQVLSVYSPLLI